MRYSDVTDLKSDSYVNYSPQDLAGAVVFVGGKIDPDTKREVDKTHCDDGSPSQGVFDIASAFLGYASQLCPQH